MLEVMENDPFISTPQDEANAKAKEEARMQVNISFTWLLSNWRLILVCLYSPLQIPHRASLTEKSLTTGAPRQSRKQRTAAIKSRTERGFNLSTPVAAYSPSSLFSLHPYSDRPEHIRVQILSASNLTSPHGVLFSTHLINCPEVHGPFGLVQLTIPVFLWPFFHVWRHHWWGWALE